MQLLLLLRCKPLPLLKQFHELREQFPVQVARAQVTLVAHAGFLLVELTAPLQVVHEKKANLPTQLMQLRHVHYQCTWETDLNIGNLTLYARLDAASSRFSPLLVMIDPVLTTPSCKEHRREKDGWMKALVHPCTHSSSSAVRAH